MSKLMVSATDSRSFLEQVIDHGIGHNLLSENRRGFLSESCDSVHSDICLRLGLNQWNAAETLRAGVLVLQLLSLALEKMSQGNLSVAVAILQEKSPANLIIEQIKEIEQHTLRIPRMSKAISLARVMIDDGIDREEPSSVRVSKVREWTGGTSGLLLFNFAEPRLWESPEHQVKERLRLVSAFSRYTVYKSWLADLDNLEYEYKVSQKYLPWSKLQQEAKFVGIGVETEARAVWTAETLISTMLVIFNIGGSNVFVSASDVLGRPLSFGTVLPVGHLAHLMHTLKWADDFRKKSLWNFGSYLDATVPQEDQRAKAYLLRMAEGAIETLLNKPLPGPEDIFSWSERLHVQGSNKVMERSWGRKMQLPGQDSKSRAERLIEAVENEKSRSSITKMLKKLDWSEATKDGFLDDLFQKLDPDQVLENLPLLPEYVERLCGFWSTTMGRQVWKAPHRQILAQRLLQVGTPEFWRTIHEDATKALAEAYPERREAFLALIA